MRRLIFSMRQRTAGFAADVGGPQKLQPSELQPSELQHRSPVLLVPDDLPGMTMFEVEQKFRVIDLDSLQTALQTMTASAGEIEHHADTYYNHPCRDFAETREAFRIRRVDGIPMITYKGPKLVGGIKAREEIEWRLDPGDPDGEQMEQLLQILGFRRVECVQKRRCPYHLTDPWSETNVVIDHVDRVGVFAELEMVVAGREDVEPARHKISELSENLGLRAAEQRSYLEMLLESISGEG